MAAPGEGGEETSAAPLLGKLYGGGQVAGLEARGWDPVLLGGAGVMTPGGDLGGVGCRGGGLGASQGQGCGQGSSGTQDEVAGGGHSLFHFMQTLTHTHRSLKIIH